MSELKSLIQDFAAPGAALRGAPFWAWNGKLDPAELRRQIRLFRRMGLGGFFMHARVGLGTEYLSPEWFDCIRACQEEAAQNGMIAYLYDEDRWPSGAAGGLVTADPRFRQRVLKLFELTPEQAASHELRGTVLLLGAGLRSGRRLSGFRQLESLKAPVAPGETVLVFEARLTEPSSWYNYQTYLDTMNPEAVKRFLEVTHERYFREVGATFEGVSPAIFTDEPNFGQVGQVVDAAGTESEMPWTDAVPAEFKRRFGYELIPHLPELFFEPEAGCDAFPTRLRYMEIVTSLFVNSFSRQIGAWCGQHGIAFTGHVLMEDTLSEQTKAVGDAMRFYEYMQIPGMDLLTEHWRVYDTAKQVSSAARQFGRSRRLTETYGCTGWDFPFAGHKALGDWQLALGINLRCPHLSYYTMAAEAKRDYPAAIFYQSPWFADYPVVEDYFARLNAVLTRGEEVRELLVLHPVESMWGLIGKDFKSAPETRALDDALIALRDELLARQLDFDYGCEEILSRHAAVTGDQLQVGRASYRVVLVPKMLTMRRSTLNLLRQFAAAGGVVVFAAAPPERVDGVPDRAVVEFAAGRTPDDWAAAVEPARRLRVFDENRRAPESVLTHLRHGEEFDALFLCNTGHRPEQLRHVSGDDPTLVRDRTAAWDRLTVELYDAREGVVIELDPESGKYYRAAAVYAQGTWRISTSLAALGSRLFLICSRLPSGVTPEPRPTPGVVARSLVLDGRWRIRRSDPNPVVLDHFEAASGDGPFGPPEYVLALDDRLRQQLQLPCRGGAMPQPYLRSREEGETIRLRLRTTFFCETLPGAPVRLALEFPERYRIALNGTPVAPDDESGWYCDRSLRCLPLALSAFRPGVNTLELETDFNGAHPGLESMFLLGEFGTRMRSEVVTALTAPVTELELGDWTAQGLTNYAGNLIYTRRITGSGGRGRLRLGDWRGVALRILIDGVPRRVLGWPPYEWELDGLPPEFELGIEVIGHRRNAFGPFYGAETWPVWTGPGEFKAYVGSERKLVPCGLLRASIWEFLR